jgi:cell division protein ZapE
MAVFMTPLQRYQDLTTKGEISFDEAQQQALMALHQLHQQIMSPHFYGQAQGQPSVLGLYLWGKVGRGKTFLMDSFVASFTEGVCLRQHFHHFMQDVHSQLTQLSGCADPLKKIAKQLKQRYQVLCFDEFFVNDIGDAMLLGRLVMFLFEENMMLVATSNCEPSELYKDGLQRVNFLPAIDAIYKNMTIIELAGSKDHRERESEALKNYLVINDDDESSKTLIKKAFDCFGLNIELAGKSVTKSGTLEVLGRDIHYLDKHQKAIAFDFNDLCLGPRSHFDYIELAKQFDTVFLMNVPAAPKTVLWGRAI